MRPPVRWLLVASAFLVAVGCDGDEPPVGDAAADTSTPPDGGAGDEVNPPSPVVLTPCAAGWEEREDDGVTVCAPFPGRDRPERCARADSAHFPGEPGCTVVGTECPAGDFPVDLPPGRPIVYVLAGATGGDGSESAPLGTIADAISAADPGAVIAIGKGRYDGGFTIRDGVTLIGACVAETVLTSSVRVSSTGVIVAGAGPTEVKNLRIADALRPAIWVGRSDAVVNLEQVVVEGSETAGVVIVLGGSVTATDLVVRDTQPLMPDQVFGRGVIIQDGSHLTVSRGAFERNREVGVYASDEGSTLSLEDVSVWDTQGLSGDIGGRGVTLQLGAVGEIHRSAVVENRYTGIFVGSAGLTISDAAIVATDADAGDGDGAGLRVQDSSLDAARIYTADNHTAGVFIAGSTTSARIEDFVALRTQPDLAGDYGRGIDVIDGAQVEVFRAHIAHSHDLGVFAAHPGSRLLLEDAVVRDTVANAANGDFGRAVSAQEGGRLELVRARLERNRDVAIYARAAGSELVLTDVVVDTVLAQENDGTGGRALNVQEGAAVTWDRGRVTGLREIALFVHGDATTAQLDHVEVTDTGPRLCFIEGTCPERAEAGIGLGSYAGATVRMNEFVISAANACGLQISGDSSTDLMNGLIERSPIGACVQIEGYDLDRLSNNVAYDNETNLQATSLPVPGSDSGNDESVATPFGG